MPTLCHISPDAGFHDTNNISHNLLTAGSQNLKSVHFILTKYCLKKCLKLETRHTPFVQLCPMC